jgi:hypothetical protein
MKGADVTPTHVSHPARGDMLTRRPLLHLIVGLIVAVGVLFAAEAAHAISKKQADKIAMRVLKVDKKKDVILFRAPAKLKPSAKVSIVPAPKKAPKKLGKRAWLYWADLAPYALFSHPSELLLIADKTGKVIRRQKLDWWPVVNGKKPAFLRTNAGYKKAKFRVFEKASAPKVKINLAKILKRTLSSVGAPQSSLLDGDRDPTGGVIPPVTPPTGPPITQDTFKHDCVLMIGDLTERLTARDFPAIRQFGNGIGLRTFYANRASLPPTTTRPRAADEPDGSGAGLTEDLRHLVDAEGCRDVLIFLSGHGEPAARSADASISLRGPSRTVKAPALRAAVAAFPNVTFKFKINACYSGRFADELKTGPDNAKALPPNILIVETSSRSGEVSYGPMNHMYVDRARTIVRNAIQRGAPGSELIRTARDRARAINAVIAELRRRAGFVANPNNLGEFVNGNLTGMQVYLAAGIDSRTVGSSALATMLKSGNDNAGKADLARSLGRTHPVMAENAAPIIVEDRLQPPGTSCTTIGTVGPAGVQVYQFVASGTCTKKLVFMEIRGGGAFTVTAAPPGMAPLPATGGGSEFFTGCVNAGAPVSFTFQGQGSWLHAGVPITIVYTFSDGSVVKEVVTPGAF